MKKRVFQMFIMTAFVGAFLLVPFTVLARSVNEDDYGMILITEIQTGALSASDEFVELYNNSNTHVDITGWQVRYSNASKGPEDTKLLVTIEAADDSHIILNAHEYYVLYKSGATLPVSVAGQEYRAALSKGDKTIGLFARDEDNCQMIVQDAVAWEGVPGTTYGEGTAIAVDEQESKKEKLLQRYMNGGEYVDTDNNSHDFLLVSATPGADNTTKLTPEQPGSPSALSPVAAPNCNPTVPDPHEDPRGPLITEILPNPGAPLTDAADEFVELYNPNDQVFDLSGYSLEAGLTTKYTYTFPEGTHLDAGNYHAFFATETKLTLANSGGQVRLLSHSGKVVDETSPYSFAAADKAWAFIDEIWQWVDTATPGEEGITDAQIVTDEDDPEPENDMNSEQRRTEHTNVGLEPAQIVEILPNPGSPKTDAEDEFIELYNPNDSPFDLAGYTLEVGLSNVHNWSFPDGAKIQPHAFLAYFSAETGLALSNTGSQARLIDPSGASISQTDPYSNAKDDQAWAFVNDRWQWTSTPTPNGANVLGVAQIKTASTKKSKKSSSKTKSTNEIGEDSNALAATLTPNDPLHPGLLALIGGFALLYGAYEYRQDVANKIRQFRTNRAARLAARQGPKGR